jgi:hypothetical protein
MRDIDNPPEPYVGNNHGRVNMWRAADESGHAFGRVVRYIIAVVVFMALLTTIAGRSVN